MSQVVIRNAYISIATVYESLALATTVRNDCR